MDKERLNDVALGEKLPWLPVFFRLELFQSFLRKACSLLIMVNRKRWIFPGCNFSFVKLDNLFFEGSCFLLLAINLTVFVILRLVVVLILD